MSEEDKKKSISHINISEIESEISNMENEIYALQENNLFLEKVIDIQKVMIFSFSSNLSFSFITKSFQKKYNIQKGDALSGLFTPSSVTIMKNLYNYDSAYNHSFTLNTKDKKTLKVIEYEAFNICSEKYFILHVTENALNSLEKNALNKILYDINTPVIITDNSHSTLFINEEAEKHLHFQGITSENQIAFSVNNIPKLINHLLSNELLSVKQDEWKEKVELWSSSSRVKNEITVHVINIAEKTYYITTFNSQNVATCEESKMFKIAFFDSLTNLPNRAFTFNYIESLINKSKDSTFAILYLDLDGFKDINDTHGHKAGDYVLKITSNRMVCSIRENDFIARIGGDEFLIVLSRYQSKENIEKITENIRTQIEKPIQYDSFNLETTVSIGIALYPKDGQNVDKILENSDVAMYAAKNNGKNQIIFFDDSLKKDTSNRKLINSTIKATIKKPEKHLSIYTQPIVQAESFTNYTEFCYECLSRFKYNDTKLNTEEVIISAENSHLIEPLGEIILEETLKKISTHHTQVNKESNFSINISAEQLTQIDFPDFFLNHLSKHEILNNKIVIELTETAVINNLKILKENMKALTKNGIRFFLDDFGSGYAALSSLYELPLHSIKVSQKLTQEIPSSDNVKLIVKKIISICKALNYNLIIEGVETKPQLNWFLENGAEYIQGYIFAKPKPFTT